MADVEIDKERKQNVVVSVVLPDTREITMKAQTAVKAVADMSLSETVKIPDDILEDTFSVIRKWLKEVL